MQQGPAGRRRSRAPVALLVVGIAMTVLGWGAFVVALVAVGAEVWEDARPAFDVDGDVEGRVDVPGSGEVTLAAGDWVVMGLGDGLVATSRTAGTDHTERTGFSGPGVTVTTAEGRAVPTRSPAVEVLRDTPSGDAASLVAFTLDEGTTVTISAEGGDGTVRSVGVLEETDISEEVLGYAVPTLVAVGGALVGSIGPFLAIGGGIWMALSSSSSHRRPPWPGPGPDLSSSHGGIVS